MILKSNYPTCLTLVENDTILNKLDNLLFPWYYITKEESEALTYAFITFIRRHQEDEQ